MDGVLALDDGELDVEHFAPAVFRALEKSVLAGTTGTDIHLCNDDRPVRDDVEAALSTCVIVVHSTNLLSLT
jgi:hypothetical protein